MSTQEGHEQAPAVVGTRGLAPHTGDEARWEIAPASPVLSTFGSRPRSKSRSESLPHSRRDVLGAAVIFAMLLALGGAYVSGAFEPKRHHAPSQSRPAAPGSPAAPATPSPF